MHGDHISFITIIIVTCTEAVICLYQSLWLTGKPTVQYYIFQHSATFSYSAHYGSGRRLAMPFIHPRTYISCMYACMRICLLCR